MGSETFELPIVTAKDPRLCSLDIIYLFLGDKALLMGSRPLSKHIRVREVESRVLLQMFVLKSRRVEDNACILTIVLFVMCIRGPKASNVALLYSGLLRKLQF